MHDIFERLTEVHHSTGRCLGTNLEQAANGHEGEARSAAGEARRRGTGTGHLQRVAPLLALA